MPQESRVPKESKEIETAPRQHLDEWNVIHLQSTRIQIESCFVIFVPYFYAVLWQTVVITTGPAFNGSKAPASEQPQSSVLEVPELSAAASAHRAAAEQLKHSPAKVWQT